MPAQRSESRRRVAGLVVLALLLGLVAWSVATLQPPAPAAADAPATGFSAARAFEHVQQIAAQTHVAGSETSYGEPLAAALAWAGAGAEWIHLVDLDAAFGRGSNRELLAGVENGPLSATQFHPEKSGDAGAQLLTNWLATLD